MGAYSVISAGALAAGQPEDVSVVLANFNAIAAVINALDNSNIAPAAAIAYSKLALTGSIVNSDIAPAAAIAASKLAGIGAALITQNVSSTNTDLAAPTAFINYWAVSTGGGTLRSVAIPTSGIGTRLSIRNGSATAFTVKHALAGGTGAQFFLRGSSDCAMAANDILQFEYDGTWWIETSRDQPNVLAYSQITAGVGPISATTDPTAVTVVGPTASINFDGVTPVFLEFYCIYYTTNQTAQTVFFSWWMDGAGIGVCQAPLINSTLGLQPGLQCYRYTPSAGNHTFTLKAWVSGGTVTFGAGGGGAANNNPSFLRVVRAI